MYVILCAVSLLTLFVKGDGADLPASIVAENTVSIGDLVPAIGSVLHVTSMLANSGAVEAVVFHAELLQFRGTLQIECPTTASEFSKPLLVTIVNGSTNAGMSATAHINVSGVLTGGSRVSIIGGSYTFINSNPIYFMQATSFVISGRSVVELIGLSFAMPPTFTGGGFVAVLLSGPSSPITLSESSNLSIVDITMSMFNVSVVGVWEVYILYTFSSPTTLSNESRVSISGTTFGMSNVSVGTNLMLCVVFANSSPITLSDSSSFSIEETTVVVHNATASGFWDTYGLYISHSSTTLSNRSILSFVNTFVELSDVKGDYGRFFLLFATLSSITLSINTTLSIVGTTANVYNAKLGVNLRLNFVSVTNSPITVVSDSTMSIKDSTIGVHNVTMMSFARLWVMYSFSPIALYNNSALTIEGIAVVVDNVKVGSNWQFYVLWLASIPSTISDNSAITIDNSTVATYNVAVAGNWQFYVLWVQSSMTIVSDSTLSIKDTTIGMHNVTTVGFAQLWIMSTSSYLALSNNSTLTIERSTVGANNAIAGGDWLLYILSISTTLSIPLGSSVSVVGVAVDFASVNQVFECVVVIVYEELSVSGLLLLRGAAVGGLPARWLSASTSVTGTGHVVVANMATEGVREMVSVPQLISGSAPTFHVCRNYVNGTLCALTPNSFPCAVNISHHVRICTQTSTLLAPPTASSLSLTASTSQPSNTRTLSSSGSRIHTIASNTASNTGSRSYGSFRAHTSSASAPSTSPTRTLVEVSKTPTISANSTRTPSKVSSPFNGTLLTQVTNEFPLVHVTTNAAAVSSGLDIISPTLHPCPKLLELITWTSKAGFVQLTKLVPQPLGLFADDGGFFSGLPVVNVSLPSASFVNIRLAALPSYSTEEGETLLLFTSMRALLGNLSFSLNVDDATLDASHLLATIVVSPDKVLGATSGTTTGVVILGGSAGMAGEVQILGVIGMMGCGDPITRARFGSYRVLSPAALTESYSGALLGNAVVVAGVALTQLVVLWLSRCCRRARLVEHMAMARFPSLTIMVAATVHAGTGFSSAQLVSQPGKYETWEVAVGALGMVYALGLPLWLSLYPYFRVERSFQTYAVSAFLEIHKWPGWTRHVIPKGAIYSPETRRAYGSTLVSGYVSEPTQIWWMSMAAWTATITTLGTLFHPNTVVGCQIQLVVMGIAIVATGLATAVFKPLRTTSSNWFACCSRVCAGLVFICAAASLVEIGQATNGGASTLLFAIGLALLAVTILQVAFALFAFFAEGKMIEENLTLTLTWAHIINQREAFTQRFNTEDGLAELEEVACLRSGPDDTSQELMVIDRESTDDANSETSSTSLSESHSPPTPTPPPSNHDDQSSATEEESVAEDLLSRSNISSATDPLL